MPKRIPISAAAKVGKEQGCQQVILTAWDGERTHVVTWGKTAKDCEQAAQGGSLVKRACHWPDTRGVPFRMRPMADALYRLVRACELPVKFDRSLPAMITERERAMKAAKSVLDGQPIPEWNTGTPSEAGYYLAAISNKDRHSVRELYYSPSVNGWAFRYSEGCIVGWRPLPAHPLTGGAS